MGNRAIIAQPSKLAGETGFRGRSCILFHKLIDQDITLILEFGQMLSDSWSIVSSVSGLMVRVSFRRSSLKDGAQRLFP